MSGTKVRSYTTKELLEKAKTLDSFNGFPSGYWLFGIRSNENTPNVYDDKIYLFEGEKFIDVITATTNSGSYGFQNYKQWNKDGAGEIKANEWYYDVWKMALHKGKMDALVQVGGFKIIRKKSYNDTNTNWTLEFWKGFNFHCNTYNVLSKAIEWMIGGWSVGCQVANDREKYFKKWVPWFKSSKQRLFTYLLVDEF